MPCLVNALTGVGLTRIGLEGKKGKKDKAQTKKLSWNFYRDKHKKKKKGRTEGEKRLCGAEKTKEKRAKIRVL